MEPSTSLMIPSGARFDDGKGGYPTAWRSLRGRRGGLAQLPDLPLDVLLEIFGNLQPLDLLRLARSFKKMRLFLMKCNMSWVWKQARSNVEGLPDCPLNMSEPAYANLVFSPHCHYCGFEPVSKIIWSTRDRACKTCFQKHYEQKSKLMSEPLFRSLPPEARKFAQVTGTIIHNPAFQPITSRDTRRQIFNVDILRQLVSEHDIIKDNRLSVEVWLARVREKYNSWEESMPALIEWHDNKALKRKEELDAARSRRFDAIYRKLENTGWREELEMMDLDLLRNHSQVKQPKDLTDRIWNGIGPSVITFMEEIKAQRLHKARVERITSRRMVFARYIANCDTYYPITIPIANLSKMKPFRSIIEDLPAEQTVTISSFPLPEETYSIFCRWQFERKHDLLNIVKTSAFVSPDAGIGHLDLATTFFRCQGQAPWEPIGQWQGIITHPATFSWRPHAKHPSVALTRLFEDFQQEYWNNGNRISFHEPAHIGARSIVVACGLDPGTTTAAFMDHYNPIIECFCCSDLNDFMEKRLLMTWRRGVVHAIDHVDHCKPAPQWIVVDPGEPCHAQAVAQIASQPAYYRCHICNALGDSQSINSHIKTTHVVRQRVTLTRQPPSAVTVNQSSKNNGWDMFCRDCNSFRRDFGGTCWNCGVAPMGP